MLTSRALSLSFVAVTLSSLIAGTATAQEKRVAKSDWSLGFGGSDGDRMERPDTTSPAPPREKAHRRFGLGMLAGAGFDSAQAFIPLAVSIGSLEAQIFMPHDFSIDLSSSLNGSIFYAVSGRAYVTQDAFMNFNVGKGIARFIVGPGLGFTVDHYEGRTMGAFRVPAEVGLELLTRSQQFGFKIVTRPWFQVPVGQTKEPPSGGAVLLLGASGYFVK